MTRPRVYVPEIHDPILTEMCRRWRRSDQAIADEMGFCKTTVREQRVRLGLPGNYLRHPAPYPAQEPPPPKARPNPVHTARLWLGPRVVEKPSGYFLDGVPVNLTTMMREANRMMKEQGAEQLAGNPAWLV